MPKKMSMKTGDLSKRDKKARGWLPVALIGALQAPAILLSLFFIPLTLILLNVGPARYLLAVLGFILTLIALPIANSFTFRKLDIQHPYKIVAIGTVLFYFSTSVQMSLINQLMPFNKFSLPAQTLVVLIVEIILGAASYLIAYSVTKRLGAAK